MSALTFEGVTVRYGSGPHAIDAVRNVQLTVPARTIVGLVGESGSGKSTLARAAVGLTPLTAGSIRLDGTPSERLDRREGRGVQMIFQDPYGSLNPRMTIGASIAEAMPRRRRAHPSARQSAVEELLGLVDIDSARARDLPHAFSGGQRQRVAIARALAADPRVIIADEITSALDVSTQGLVLNLVRDLQRRLGLSMLFISHNMAVVRYVSDVIAVMYLGQIVECGPASDVLNDPQHPYTRELLGSVPRDGVVSLTPQGVNAAAADMSDAEPPDPRFPPSGCRFHTRCPVGPLASAAREICLDVDPATTAESHRHRASCHFAEVEDPILGASAW